MADLHETASKFIQLDHLDVVYDIERSYGNYFYDSKSNRALLDCFSFIASNPIGHNHPGLNDPDFEKKLLKVAKTKPSNSDILTEEYVSFLETFDRVLNPGKWFKRYFFVSGGTLAVDNALKTAFDWKHRTVARTTGKILQPNDMRVVYLTKAFHGRSGYPLTIMGNKQKSYLFPKFENWIEYDPTSAVTLEGVLYGQDISNVAAIVVEPYQGEGGDRLFPESFHERLREFADRYQIVLIYDEVQTGVGMSGKTWAFEHYGIVPDILCFGKKAQVCGIAVTDKILSCGGNVFEEKSRINSTFGGDLTDMVRCQRYLEVIESESLVENAKVVGEEILKNLLCLKLQFMGLVSNPRGLGLLTAFDLPTKELRNQFIQLCLKNGALVLGSGEQSIRFRPSLTFTVQDVKSLTSILSMSLDELAKGLNE